jgi:hypothetical protein
MPTLYRVVGRSPLLRFDVLNVLARRIAALHRANPAPLAHSTTLGLGGRSIWRTRYVIRKIHDSFVGEKSELEL